VRKRGIVRDGRRLPQVPQLRIQRVLSC
jgi:hypothetical protein